jgi:hypothetical protein
MARMNSGFPLSASPVDGYFKATAGSQPADRTFAPSDGQCREKMQDRKQRPFLCCCGLVTLQEHFGDGRGGAKVTVNLEGGMVSKRLGSVDLAMSS